MKRFFAVAIVTSAALIMNCALPFVNSANSTSNPQNYGKNIESALVAYWDECSSGTLTTTTGDYLQFTSSNIYETTSGSQSELFQIGRAHV
jgi:hypothetical protein